MYKAVEVRHASNGRFLGVYLNGKRLTKEEGKKELRLARRRYRDKRRKAFKNRVT